METGSGRNRLHSGLTYPDCPLHQQARQSQRERRAGRTLNIGRSTKVRGSKFLHLSVQSFGKGRHQHFDCLFYTCEGNADQGD